MRGFCHLLHVLLSKLQVMNDTDMSYLTIFSCQSTVNIIKVYSLSSPTFWKQNKKYFLAKMLNLFHMKKGFCALCYFYQPVVEFILKF